jgi:hypothetical protein
MVVVVRGHHRRSMATSVAVAIAAALRRARSRSQQGGRAVDVSASRSPASRQQAWLARLIKVDLIVGINKPRVWRVKR